MPPLSCTHCVLISDFHEYAVVRVTPFFSFQWHLIIACSKTRWKYAWGDLFESLPRHMVIRAPSTPIIFIWAGPALFSFPWRFWCAKTCTFWSCHWRFADGIHSIWLVGIFRRSCAYIGLIHWILNIYCFRRPYYTHSLQRTAQRVWWSKHKNLIIRGWSFRPGACGHWPPIWECWLKCEYNWTIFDYHGFRYPKLAP